MMGEIIIYRGWEIDRYRKPDRCFYAYAPDYDGLTPSDTQCAPTLHELCDSIDDVISERSRALR
jgi:DNA polymerase III epsilon subunit-like protein